MPATQSPKQTIQFGVFEVNVASRELRKQGVRIKLQEQPLLILELLLERAGEIVSREEIRQRIWPADTFVDFDKGLYNAIKKLREALGDIAATPRFIETIPKRGYRFIAPVNVPVPAISISPMESEARLDAHPRWSKRIAWAMASLLLLSVVLVLVWRRRIPRNTAKRPPVSVLGEGAFSFTVDQYDRRLLAYYRGIDSNLYQLVWPWDPSQWSQLTGSHGKPAAARGTGIASFVNTLNHQPEVFYVTQGQQHIEEVSVLGFVPTDLNIATGAPAAVPGSSLSGFIDECAQTDNVFYVGEDHHIHLLTSSVGTGWTTQDLTSLTHNRTSFGGTLFALANREAGQVFYFQSDHHVHQLWRWSGCPGRYPFDGWHSADLNRANKEDAPAAIDGSGLSVLTDLQSEKQDVFYVDSHNHLQGLFFVKISWTNIDVTRESGAPALGAGSFVSQFNPIWGSASVYFLDANRDLHVVTSKSSAPTQWRNPLQTPISAVAGRCLGSGTPLPPAVRGSPLASAINYFLNASEDISYLGTDQHMYQVEMGEGVWDCVDVTKVSGAPLAEP
ncbi:MAG TPA: winged helix-turn-helix domain-containing protein [Candidatus Acidoferrales bacterium]|nr:winged helix-turn-helix domain-containing protein [Candidatus Acidoferrales bacterium]